MVLSEVDELDLKIIKTLQEDARASYRKVAEKLDIATGTVQNRVHRLEDIGIIQGYHCHLNYAKLGFNITALIGISIKKEDTARLEKKLKANKNVYGMFYITGDYDFMLAVKFRVIEDLNEFIKAELADPSITRTTTFLVLNTLKEEHHLL